MYIRLSLLLGTWETTPHLQASPIKTPSHQETLSRRYRRARGSSYIYISSLQRAARTAFLFRGPSLFLSLRRSIRRNAMRVSQIFVCSRRNLAMKCDPNWGHAATMMKRSVDTPIPPDDERHKQDRTGVRGQGTRDRGEEMESTRGDH